jgi:rhomboid protease GluP
MVRLAHAARASLSGHEQAMAELFVLAFTGRPAALALLLARPLGYLDTESKDYWQAVADLSVPDRAAAGRAALARLKSATRSDRLRNSVDRHLVGEPRARLSAEARNVVNEIEHRVIHASEAGLGTLARVPVTIALLAANLLVFGLEVLYGGSEDLDVLVELGAMWPPLVTEAGEWWRLASSVFLHYGPVHLGANMFMLLILGRMVEPAYGWLRFLTIYLAGGIGAAGLVLALMVVGGVSEGILIGASGAIFALFGAEVARQLAAWRRSRDALDRRQLVNLGLIMLVQVVIDLSVPEISGAAHLAGAAIGLALGLALGAGTALRGVREA